MFSCSDDDCPTHTMYDSYKKALAAAQPKAVYEHAEDATIPKCPYCKDEIMGDSLTLSGKHSQICDKCGARGPVKPTEAEALAAARINRIDELEKEADELRQKVEFRDKVISELSDEIAGLKETGVS